MQFAEIREFLGDIPFMQPERARVLYQHIRQSKPMQVLELGIAHGVGSCYIAAALDENGEGYLTGVDLETASFAPSAEELVSRAKLDSYVSIHREKNSYTWYLKKLIEERTRPGGICEPLFDLCYIDGPKNWTIDGAAFFMVDKLMKPEGWIIFDDYDWTYASVYDQKFHTKSDGIDIVKLAEDERTQPHIQAIFRLLVAQHPDYGEFWVDGNSWAWAHKVNSNERKIHLTYAPDFRYTLSTKLRSISKNIRAARK